MKRRTLLTLAGLIGLILTGMAAQAQVINLNDYDNSAGGGGGNEFVPFVGPGVYSGATANDIWNGFGLGSSSLGTGLVTSTGAATGIGYSIHYDSNDDGLTDNWEFPNNGTPAFLFGNAAAVIGQDVGTLTLKNVPQSTFNLYLYGANFDGMCGAVFTVSSGLPVDGVTTITDPRPMSSGDRIRTFNFGLDYIEFVGVTPDRSGNINISWTRIPSNNSGGTGQGAGEGAFNGMSLVEVPEPSTNWIVTTILLAAFSGGAAIHPFGRNMAPTNHPDVSVHS
jgi:hypothetical protein